MKFLIVLVAALAVAAAGKPRLESLRGVKVGRVVGGVDAPDNAAPYIVSLRLLGSHSCGGSIINENWVITAAHCLASYPATWYEVGVGANRRSQHTQIYDVAEKIQHERYNSPQYHNDIGLVRLATPITFNDRVQPIVLNTEELDDGTMPITLYGWGRTSTGGAIPDALQVIDLIYVNYENCRAAHVGQNQQYVGPDHFCTYTKFGEGACNGDSGGPLVYGDKLVALVNWGIACAQGYPDVHNKVSAYIDWVNEKIGA